MNKYPTWKAVINKYHDSTDKIRDHFGEFENLMEFSWDVILAYVFFKLEQAQLCVLYGGLVKTHSVNTEIAWRVLDCEHITRNNYGNLFNKIFDKEMNKQTMELIDGAKAVRDKIMHGKKATDREQRNAVGQVLEYCIIFEEEIKNLAGFSPFGDMRGIKGAAKSFPKKTSKLIVKGLGFRGLG